MKKNLFKLIPFCILFISGIILPLSALEVDEQELKDVSANQSIVFENYTGPHAKIDTAAQIKQIGTALGKIITADVEKSSVSGSPDRYYVIHAVDPGEKEKLDADIFFIGKSATVDHIDNVRRILAAYLTSAYNYSPDDAQTLSVFITVYNAVYRGQLDSYKEKYKQIVIKNLSADNCGIALSYKDWAGKTELVIPLSDVAGGGLSTVETSVISDKQVVKSMQNEEGKNINERKNMVDIKEKEAATASDKAEASQKQAVEEQNKLAEAKETLETKKTEAAAAQKKAAENPEDKQVQKEAQTKQEEVQAQEKKVAEQQNKTETAKQEAAVQQDKADKKQAEAQEERTQIANDQQKIIEETRKNISVEKAYGIKLIDDKSLVSGMVQVNAATGEVIEESPVTVIRGRTFFKAGKNYIAIAGENKGNGAIKLVLLDPDKMEIIKESNEIVSPDSVLIQDGENYYCIIKNNNNWVLAKYDADLKLLLASDTAVEEATPVSMNDSGIVVTDATGVIKFLDKTNLKPIVANTGSEKQ